MTRIGTTTTDVLPPCSGADGCSQPVVVVVLFYDGAFIEATTGCEGHAPEVVHEARSSMHESEFVILEVPK